MSEQSPDRPNLTTFHILAFSTRAAAEQAYEDIIGLGVLPDDITLFVHAKPPEDPRQDAKLDHEIDVGGKVGAGISALAGGAAGLLTGLGLLVIPGIGPLLAVGPLAAALTGAITGGALGGVAGSLIGAGVAEASALAAEKHLAAGRSIVTLADTAWTAEIAEVAHRSPALIGIDHA